jgi:hypothetical protein
MNPRPRLAQVERREACPFGRTSACEHPKIVEEVSRVYIDSNLEPCVRAMCWAAESGQFPPWCPLEELP